VHRFECVTGKPARLAATGQTFEAVAQERGRSRSLTAVEETVP
jgi:hypothetical protein